MPDCAAHYQFGQDVLHRLDLHLKAAVLAYKREYDIGLQGPDIFFFYQPYRKTAISDYGTERHEQPAIQMFAPILEKVREKAELAYMMGLICHYMLDAYCHPYINQHSNSIIEHHWMEYAYDQHIVSRLKSEKPRYLLTQAGKLDFASMASLWPGMNSKVIRKCMSSRRFYTWILDRKSVMYLLEAAARKRATVSRLFLSNTVLWKQRSHVRHLDELYNQALELTPKRIRQACMAMGTVVQGLDGFEMNYEGEVMHEQTRKELGALRCG